MELEGAAHPHARGSYAMEVVDAGEGWEIDPRPAIRRLAEDARAGTKTLGAMCAAFHRGLAESAVGVAERVRDAYDVHRVGLTGGVFQNALLTELCSALLEAGGFEVLIHRAVPCNDGGLSLGQAIVAAARSASAPSAAVPAPLEEAPCA